MNERLQDNPQLNPEYFQRLGAIGKTVGTAQNVIDSTQKNVAAMLRMPLISCAQCIQRIQDAIEQQIQQAIAGCGCAIGGCCQTIDQTLQSQLNATLGVIGLCQKIIDRNAKIGSTYAANAGTIGAADAAFSTSTSSPQSGSQSTAGSASSSGGNNTSASFIGPNWTPPAPPNPGQLAGLVLPGSSPAQSIPLEQLPAEYWSTGNQLGIFLSLAQTPISAGTIQAVDITTQPPARSLTVYVNVTLPWPWPTLAQIAEQLGIASNSVHSWTQTEITNNAYTTFGGQTVNNVYQTLGIVPQTPQNGSAKASGAQNSTTTPVGEQSANGANMPQNQPAQPEEKDCVKICGFPPEQPQFVGVFDDLNTLLQRFDPANWPGLCDLARLAARNTPIDASQFWPCITITEMARRIYGG